jgi:hypothetical protein
MIQGVETDLARSLRPIPSARAGVRRCLPGRCGAAMGCRHRVRAQACFAACRGLALRRPEDRLVTSPVGKIPGPGVPHARGAQVPGWAGAWRQGGRGSASVGALGSGGCGCRQCAEVCGGLRCAGLHCIARGYGCSRGTPRHQILRFTESAKTRQARLTVRPGKTFAEACRSIDQNQWLESDTAQHGARHQRGAVRSSL